MIDSNSVLFHFILPSLFAAIFSAILQGIGQTTTTATLTTTAGTNTVTYNALLPGGRDATTQGGYQMAGWAISIGSGAFAGLLIGLLYKLLNDNFEEPAHFFNDGTLFEYPKVSAEAGQPAPENANGDIPESRKAL